MLTVGQTVDVFVTAVVNVNDPTGQYIPDRSTKITYQDVVILARKDAFYIIRATLPVAEELAHLQATGSATFSLALRPVEDQRLVDASALGETTNRIIVKYGLPIPEAISPGLTPAASTPPPAASPGPSAAPSIAPSIAPSVARRRSPPRRRERTVRRCAGGGPAVAGAPDQWTMPTPSKPDGDAPTIAWTIVSGPGSGAGDDRHSPHA